MKNFFLLLIILFSTNLFPITQDEELFLLSALKNDIKTIENLAKKGVYLDVKYDDRFGSTALHYAVRENNIEAIKTLLNLGANPNKKDNFGKTPLMWSVSKVEKNNISKILIENRKTYLDAMDDDGRGHTALYHAMSDKNYEIVKYLIAKGANIENKSTPFGPALIYAIFNNDIEMVKIIVEAGADLNVDFHNQTPLHEAVNVKGYETVKYLISKGANVNIKNELSKATPLIYAILVKQDVEMVKVLIKAGADVNTVFDGDSRHKGKSALQIAEELNNKEIINLLKKAGAK